MASKPARIPEVRIYFSWLLYDNASVPLLKDTENSDWLQDKETLSGYAANYRHEWAKYSDKILRALVDALDVEFYRDVIDAPCTPGMIPFSDPLVLNFANYPDQFVDSLMHELCHILFFDNTVWSTHSSKRRVDLNKRWTQLFGGSHEWNTLIHIPVHALSKHIYLDVLREPERLERDMHSLEWLADYKAAWGYVNAHDYREIIAQLKADYAALASELKNGTIEA